VRRKTEHKRKRSDDGEGEGEARGRGKERKKRSLSGMYGSDFWSGFRKPFW
jgi:hypothetical protein